MNIKEITSKILQYLKTVWVWLPKLIFAVLKMPTGRRILAAALVAGLAALGVKAPFEVVQAAITEVAGWVGVDGLHVTLEQIVTLILSIVLAEGTLRANDTVQDWKLAAMPGRISMQDIRTTFGEPLPSMVAKVIDGQTRLTDYYEVDKAGNLFVGTQDGKRERLQTIRPVEEQIRQYLINRTV